jgi:hypothetical protein
MINIGVKSYDIRDFFDETFVKEYKEVVIEYRNILDTNLPTTKNDGNSTKSLELIKWIEERTNKDFSYLYNKGQKEYRYDYKFVMAAYEYLDSINIDENWDLVSQLSKDVIPNFSSLSLMYAPPQSKTHKYYFMTDKINEVCLKKVIEEFPYMCNSLDDIRWNTNEWFGHMIAMPKGAFMSFHRDNTADRPFTLLNYVNVDRTREDGGCFRYFIHKDYDVEDKESLDWSKYVKFSPVIPQEDVENVKSLRYKYHNPPNKTPEYLESIDKFKNYNKYDIVANYTTVNILLHKNHKTKEEDKKYFVLETPPSSDYLGEQGIPHLVTKNKSEEIRYTLYRRVVWKEYLNELSRSVVWKDIREIK